MLIVKTTGDFTLYDPLGQTIQRKRPSVVDATPFVNERCAAKQIEILATNLPDVANDADFATYWEEAPDIAIEAYKSSFDHVETSKPKGRSK